jgi:uncharacterized protein YlxW (UPF0749 family)
MLKKGNLVIALLCFVLGIMLAVQLKTAISPTGLISLQRAYELTKELKRLETENMGLKKEIDALRQNLKMYEESASQVSVITKNLRKELEKVRLIAGLTQVSGPGIVITLNDSMINPSIGQDPTIFIIHDDDLLKIVNELWASGAEAIAINDQRVITTTEIRCTGPAISINSIRQTPPYLIKAIGNSDTLKGALELKGGIIDSLKIWGIQVHIEKKEKITIPGYKGIIDFKYAKEEG